MLEGKIICMESIGGELYFIGNYVNQEFGSVFLHMIGSIETEKGEVVLLESDERIFDMYFKKINVDKQEIVTLTSLSADEEIDIYKKIAEIHDIGCLGKVQ